MKLFTQDAAGGYVPATPTAIMEEARAVAGITLKRGKLLESPRAAHAFVSAKLAGMGHEVFCVIHVDNRHRFIDYQELFRGTLDGATVHPREVVRECLARNSAAVIFAHNHPSGVAEPSQADELITSRLKEALAMVDIRTLDHLIVAGSEVISFAERGLI